MHVVHIWTIFKIWHILNKIKHVIYIDEICFSQKKKLENLIWDSTKVVLNGY